MLELYYIGEELLKKMLEDSENVRKLFNIKDCNEIKINIPLNPINETSFDYMHQIDVGIFSNNTITPIELKLGFSNLTINTINKDLQSCEIVQNRFSGKMIAILDKKLPYPYNNSNLFVNNQIRVNRKWFFVTRNKIIETWGNHQPDFSKNCKIIGFENIVNSYGSCKKFNQLVKSIITIDNYYKEWLQQNQPE